MTNPNAAAGAEMRETPKEAERNTPETTETQPATTRERAIGEGRNLTRLDGSQARDILAGTIELEGKTFQVLARQEGDGFLFQVVSPEKDAQRQKAEAKIDLLGNAYDRVAEIVLKAAGLTGAQADTVGSALAEQKAVVLAETARAKDAETAIKESLTSRAESVMRGEQTEEPSLGALMEELLAARMGDDMEADVALSRAVSERREEMHPDADDAERARIADGTEGLVQIGAEPKYAGPDGEKKMKARRMEIIQTELFNALKRNDNKAWLLLTEELNELTAVLALRNEWMHHQDKKGTYDKQKTKNLVESKPTEENTEVEYELTDADIVELLETKPRVKSPVDLLLEDWAAADEAQKPEARPMSSESANTTLEQPAVEIETSDQKDVTRNEQAEQWFAQGQFDDLKHTGLAENAEDLLAWENTYAETAIALEALGLTMKDEGLPETFGDLLAIKDGRGFLKKLLGSTTDRVRTFRQLADIHYRYIDSGKVDIKKALERSGKTMEDYLAAIRSSKGTLV
ncbi:hypothetical protein FJZ23_03245 [Candidatus Parcubacteria bacterium]|nr:hypothetical protein [Candidatus Parcubacteria bacterium]